MYVYAIHSERGQYKKYCLQARLSAILVDTIVTVCSMMKIGLAGSCMRNVLYWLTDAEWRIYASPTYAIIGSDNGWSPGRRQAIIWTNYGISWWRIYASLGIVIKIVIWCYLLFENVIFYRVPGYIAYCNKREGSNSLYIIDRPHDCTWYLGLSTR